MADTVQNSRIGSALIAAVVLSACLALLSIWLGMRLSALRSDLAELVEANDVLQRQLSMATDTVVDVSTRLSTLREQMDIAPQGSAAEKGLGRALRSDRPGLRTESGVPQR